MGRSVLYILLLYGVYMDGFAAAAAAHSTLCVIRHTVNIDRAPNHLASSGILNTREKREEIEFDFIRVVKFPAKRFAR